MPPLLENFSANGGFWVSLLRWLVGCVAEGASPLRTDKHQPNRRQYPREYLRRRNNRTAGPWSSRHQQSGKTFPMGAQNLPRWAIAEGVKALPYLGWRFVGFAPFRLVVLQVIVVGNGLAPFRLVSLWRRNNRTAGPWSSRHQCPNKIFPMKAQNLPSRTIAEGVKALPYIS